jgi:carbamoyl-phosphate synthase large subunit
MYEIPYRKEGTGKIHALGDYLWSSTPSGPREVPGLKDVLGTPDEGSGQGEDHRKSYKEAFQKAIRSLEKAVRPGLAGTTTADLLKTSMLLKSHQRATVHLYEAIRKGADIQKLYH